MQIEMPLTFWDVLAAMAHGVSTLWYASSPGLRIVFCLLLVASVLEGPRQETSPSHARTRSRHRNRWDDRGV